MPRADALAPHTGAASERVRLDKWLWAARFFKTRALAAAAIDSGQVRVADARVKAARAVRIGERIHIRRAGLGWEVVVRALAQRRGSATEAAALYVETPESVATREAEIARLRAARAEATTGRPTKRQRRRLEDFLAEP
jgi:ribosome-associated heat shock protein Hsp15